MKIQLNQIYFSDYQLQHIDLTSIPYFNKDLNKTYEFGVFLKEYESVLSGEEDYIGFLSWKFSIKTGISAGQFADRIKKDPGYDVYGYATFQDMLRYKSVWEQAEAYHPGIINIVKYYLSKAGYNIDIENQINDKSNTLYCNFWVGNKNFWKQYMDFCLPLYDEMMKDENMYKDMLFNDYPFGFFPYIMERMWSTFIVNTELKYKVF